jgi:DNA-binding HxlR family transcriptional regulator
MAQHAPRTEYGLTEKGRDIMPLIIDIRNYGLTLIAEQQAMT